MEDGKKALHNGGSRRAGVLALGVGALAIALLLGGTFLSRSGTGRSPSDSAGVRTLDGSAQDMNRKLLDRLIDEQKYEEAARIRGEARSLKRE